MIEYLFSMLLVPLLPALENPDIGHAESLMALEQRLNQGRNSSVRVSEAKAPGDDELTLASNTESLPAITGRLFEWSSNLLVSEQARIDDLGRAVGSMRLTGIIESSGQRVAILNDGQRDYVVGVGSYVLNAYRVNSLGAGNVVLLPVDGRARGKPLELKLMPGVTPGGL
ncbi:hypothetical protein [Limnobacter parvus]|uniref:Type II secretion system protein GspC N-terminal domain-containing protein n=1 Tax=Limnobacter parvus TaxID=2939690 RepID=A0ABT1XF87_9BURK|nr:hypothetical protein [Limnobacter parvus]MCR2745943.1 hypothetical protein [Limnobacter parvus]